MAGEPLVRPVILTDEDGNPVAIQVTLEAGDVEIGAVEIKDEGSNTRAEVTADQRLSANANLQVGDADVSDENPVPVDVTGQGDVPVTLDGEIVSVDVTGQGDVPVTLGDEQVDVSDRAARDNGKVDIADIDGFASVKGQKTMAESFPVVLPSNQAAVPVDVTGQGDVPVTLDGEAVVLGAGSSNVGKVDPAASTPGIANLTLASADTEYSQAMPSNCRRFEFQCRASYDVRYQFETGKVAAPAAPYMTLKAGGALDSGPISQGDSPSTLYFASSTAGVVVEILYWV